LFPGGKRGHRLPPVFADAELIYASIEYRLRRMRRICVSASSFRPLNLFKPNHHAAGFRAGAGGQGCHLLPPRHDSPRAAPIDGPFTINRNFPEWPDASSTAPIGPVCCPNRESCSRSRGPSGRAGGGEVRQSSQMDNDDLTKKSTGECRALTILTMIINWLILVI
jgi:hypothetical protein